MDKSLEADHTLLTTLSISNLKIWHRQLGHVNYQTVAKIIQSHSLQGMPINLSKLPLEYDSYILSKQTRMSIPKTQQKAYRAQQKLEIVWVDLIGSQAVVLKTETQYMMDIVDDYSNHVCSIFLQNKDNSFSEL
ncbi:uncharacterized protein BT62DRAFT_898219 [Guyanagaster necrorhizus]|uniref:GAG-pre-integrase domain-containing protein n=1 Tax=Guyanagaster necrorhizus TaxID=856835 RepID=A0A9P8ASR3_9AGAR|nr:uncharacterized protein BT62DRAFT_898219 [Guyanagaster necrorhizus MCA 3950]KAG7445132.1 hypothetical protein BT62DRAFT_898219 [Guyanagaster necrorhizus MCA 3950]